MRHALCLSVAATMVVFGGAAVQAMPRMSGVDGAAPAVTLVADGCGPFGHRSHYGYCKNNGPDQGNGGGYGRDGYDRGGYGGGYGARGGAGFYEEGYEPEPQCFIQETYYGPRRICR